MMIFFWILLAVFIYYLINNIIVFCIIFRRGKEIPLVDLDLSKTQYKPFEKEVRYYASFFDDKKPEIVEIKSYDNLTLKGYFYNNNSDNIVIMFHGYRATPLNNFAVMGKLLYEKGYNLLMIVERAHGISEGKYISFGAKEKYDCHSWIEFVNKTYKPKNIFLYGMSMGSAVILLDNAMYKEENVRCIIADCSLDKSKNAVSFGLKRTRKFTPYFTLLGVSIIARLKGIKFKENELKDQIKNIHVPILFIHGNHDDLIPIDNMKEVYNNANEPKQFLETNALHAMSVYFDFDNVSNSILDFINKYEI